jgi:DNA-directed RNA polymerase specialized sigma24 family protein
MTKQELEATYISLEKMLHKLAWDFARGTGCDRQEAMDACNDAFLAAVKRHDPTRCKLGTLVTIYARYHMRTARSRRKPQVTDGMRRIDYSKLPTPKARSVVRELLELLTPDGLVVACLVLEAPPPVRQALDKQKGGAPVRRVLRQILFGLGWTTARVKQAFQELKEVTL